MEAAEPASAAAINTCIRVVAQRRGPRVQKLGSFSVAIEVHLNRKDSHDRKLLKVEGDPIRAQATALVKAKSATARGKAKAAKKATPALHRGHIWPGMVYLP